MEEPPDPLRHPYDLALFYRESAPASGGLQLDGDAILPVCAPALAAKLTTPADLAAQTLLHDAVWRSDWARWLGFAVPGAKVGPNRGPAFSLYSLALDACLSGSGMLMGRMSLVSPHLAAGRLVAPFPQAMPTPDRLTLATATAAGAHPRRAEIMDWLADQAGVAAQI